MMTLLTLLLLLAPAGPTRLDDVAKALRSSPAWQVRFVQTYLPAGFESGASDEGDLFVAVPDRLRFDYRGESPRVFAVDGLVAREVDAAAATCRAFRLDRGTWSRLPLAAILDPGGADAAFVVEAGTTGVRLVPRVANPDLAAVLITVSADGLPSEIVVEDPAGNRNRFRLRDWRALPAFDRALFAPHLPSQPPCPPDEW